MSLTSHDFLPTQRHFMSSESANSYLTIEWTNQHGCGGNENSDPNKLNCNMVIQFMVGDDDGRSPDNHDIFHP